MERNITPHAVNGIAKILREKRERTIGDERELEWEYTRIELLDELTLDFAEWFEKNGLETADFIRKAGYVAPASDSDSLN